MEDNYTIARKILEGQIRQAQKRPGAVDQIEASHDKLRKRGFVMKLDDLPADLKAAASEPGYFIPWRTVQSDSLSTPTRMVFDASSRTRTGYSLNCLLAKGRNMLADMMVLLLKFRFGSAAFCADVSMAYNGVLLHAGHLKFHKYLWTERLAVGGAIIIMVILTLIYGVRPAGNLTMQAFRITADIADRDPVLRASGGPACLREKAYMDDVFSAFFNNNKRNLASDGLQSTLAVSRMAVKAVTKSGERPDERVSADQRTVNVVGYVWDPLLDTLSLDIKPLFLGKKIRGRRPPAVEGDVKSALRSKFTRREIAGKLAAVYDPLGICVPVTAKMKLALREIVKLNGDWDTLIPEEHLDSWVEILDEIQQLKQVVVPRSSLTEECDEKTRYELLTCTDASAVIAVAAVYLRTFLPDGSVSCQLLTAKSKLISKLTVPRAELRACVMGACLTEMVRRAIGEYISAVYFVTDSAVALTWINTDQRPLQVGVRNCVIQIRRFTDTCQWFHVSTDLNPADIGTRDHKPADIVADSVWQTGYEWMRLEKEEMPLKPAAEVLMSNSDKVAVSKEIRNSGLQGIVLNCMEDKLTERYQLSSYVVDPCSWPWPTVIRKVAVLLRVARAFKARGDAEKLNEEKFQLFDGRKVMNLRASDVEAAEQQLFRTASREVRQFHDVSKMKHVVEKDGILLYSGRILDCAPENPLNVMIDLQPLKLLTPVVDRWSPVAYSVMIHAHVTVSHHGGVKSTLYAALQIAHILNGKSLAVEVRQNCAYCRRYKVKLESAKMGLLPVERFTVAPAFYHIQIDLFGPLTSHCTHGRRATVKTWGAVFKCCTTLALSVHVMDGYDTATFLDAFYRHGTRYGWPAKVFIDAGGQLISAFKNGDFSMVDVTATLNSTLGTEIEYEICPVNAHEAHGLVERSIREVKKILHAVFAGLKMDILRQETVFSWVANELNSLPLCLGSEYTNLEHADLITPNRLMLGRNNRRTVAGLTLTAQPGRVLVQIDDIEKAWWNVWAKEKLGSLTPRPAKWSVGEPDIQVDDVVVFVRDKNDIVGSTWRIGLVDETEVGEDGVCRRVVVKYRKSGESVWRTTRRSARHVSVLVREEELDLPARLSRAQKAASVMMCRRSGTRAE